VSANTVTLEFAAPRPQGRRMDKREDAREASRDLARAAEPLRRSLAQFFRRRILEHSEVEDLVQETFARIVARDSTRPVENLSAYVFQTAASVLADRNRRRVVRHATDHVAFDASRHAEAELDASRILIGREDLQALVAALLSLPERTRAIFVLHRLDGRKYRDIGAQLGISVSAVEKHMLRAMEHLSDAFEEPQ
jgi:RNA polymerase sigma factor (sigma-70 family)